ncbi:MAG: ABC transporter permease [Phycisphaerae bacterium]
MSKIVRILRRIALGAIVPAALVGVWHVASQRSLVVPGIPETLEVFVHAFRRPTDLDSAALATSAAVSILRVLCGFALAVLTGIPVGLMIGGSRTLREIFAPVISGATAISPIAWIPVAIIVFGFASPATALFGRNHWQHDLLDQLRFAIIAVIWYGGFFPIVVNTAAGVSAVRRSHVEVVRVLGGSRWDVLRRVVLPSAAPSIVTGLRLGAGIAWRVIIAAEIFPGTRSGVGYMIAVAGQMNEYRYVFANIIVIAVIGVSIDALLYLAARRVGRWQEMQR